MAPAPPSAPPSDLREKRGHDTRQSLVLAGLELFGEYGIKGTTTRMLCEASGANVAAINYHFTNKEGLYLAVAEHITNRMQYHLGASAQSAMQNASAKNFSAAASRAAFGLMIDTFAHLMVESGEVRQWSRIVVREQANPTAAFDILYVGGMEKMQAMLAQMLGACTGLDPQSEEAKIRVHALIGQVLGFAISRQSLLRNLKVKRFKPAHVATICQVLNAHVTACLKIAPLSR
jgi:AcrR family transcriptional regulator